MLAHLPALNRLHLGDVLLQGQSVPLAPAKLRGVSVTGWHYYDYVTDYSEYSADTDHGDEYSYWDQ